MLSATPIQSLIVLTSFGTIHVRAPHNTYLNFQLESFAVTKKNHHRFASVYLFVCFSVNYLSTILHMLGLMLSIDSKKKSCYEFSHRNTFSKL